MQIVTDYRKALENARRLEQSGDQARADLARGLAEAIASVMTTKEAGAAGYGFNFYTVAKEID